MFEQFIRGGAFDNGLATETKFNPWHDPNDGRFTDKGSGRFAGGGGSFGGGGATARSTRTARSRKRAAPTPLKSPVVRGGGGSYGEGGATATGSWSRPTGKTAPTRPPANLPGSAQPTPPKSAAPIRVALPNVVVRNGYRFELDDKRRTTVVSGDLHLKAAKRSRQSQREAGKPNRLSNDDGGHYIAARFDGPRDEFNHFAQDANFNRGAYRALEDNGQKRSGRAHACG